VFIPASSAITIYSIRDRDIIVDDEGYRYEVGANFWTGLGYQVSTIREEA
jgi:predicted ATPase